MLSYTERYHLCGDKTSSTGELCRKNVKNKGEKCHFHSHKTSKVNKVPNVQIAPRVIQPFDQNKFVKQMQKLTDDNVYLKNSQKSLSRRVLLLEEKLLELVKTLHNFSQQKLYTETVEEEGTVIPEISSESNEYLSVTMQSSHEWLKNDQRSIDCILEEFLPELSE